MMSRDVVARVWEIAAPVVVAEGLELVDVEYRRENRGTVLRLFLDREGGIGIDELTRASRQLSDVLDVHDVVPGEYVLECSSPGINRRLRLPEHFRRFVGERVRVKTTERPDGRRQIVGRLEAVDEAGIEVVDAQGSFRIRFDEIVRANHEADV
jgi:ribosome maturation factor RimP